MTGFARTVCLLAAACLFGGCGQMGPLYMPAEESPQGAAAEPAPSAPPAGADTDADG